MNENTPIKAMILAAGRGNRLRPLTDSVPKPLVPLCGKPLIEYHIEKLAQAGVKEIVINHAWLGHKIEEALGDGARWGVSIHYSPEPEGGLETAGGIINALPLLGESPFLVINGDVYCELDFAGLIKQAQTMREAQLNKVANSLGYLLLVPSPQHNAQGDFGLSAEGLVTEKGAYTFAGISVLSPALFEGRMVEFIGLAPILRQAMRSGLITGNVESGFWSDIGTIERLQTTESILKAKT